MSAVCAFDACDGSGYFGAPARPGVCLFDAVVFACFECEAAALNPVRDREGHSFCTTWCRRAFQRRVRDEIAAAVA